MSHYCEKCGTHVGMRVRCPLPWCPSHKEHNLRRNPTVAQMVDRACDDIETAIDDRDWDTASSLLNQLVNAERAGYAHASVFRRLPEIRTRFETEHGGDSNAVWWFGPSPWGAWICQHGRRVEIPVGQKCLLSGNEIRASDRGFVLLHIDKEGFKRRAILFNAMMASVGLGAETET